MVVTMSISQNYDYDGAMLAAEETEREKAARLNRLRAAEIKRELKAIDNARIRPMAAILADVGTGEDKSRLDELEARAETLRTELSALVTEVNHED